MLPCGSGIYERRPVMDALLYLNTLKTLEQIKQTCSSNDEISAINTGMYAVQKLQDYEHLGVSPEKLQKMDEIFLEKCKEVNELKRAMKDPKRYVEMYNKLIADENKEYTEAYHEQSM